MSLLEPARKYAARMTEIRRRIHRRPELAFRERETAKLVREELAALDIPLQPLSLETAVVGVLRGAGGGPVTAVRADMDALPIAERTGLSYASEVEGVMHACGHDGHTAALLGAARLLSERRAQLAGAVKFLFQPAEETGEGAAAMIAAGALRDPAPDAVFALHGWPFLEIGTVGLRAGAMTAAADDFSCVVRGRGGHGGYPHLARDPILAACHAVAALQQIAARRVDPVKSAVVSVCAFHAGAASNIIPESAVIGGTVRTQEENVRDDVERVLREVVARTAAAFDCAAETTYRRGSPAVINDAAMSALAARAAREALGPASVTEIQPTMGAEDFSRLLQAVGRGAFVRLGLGAPGRETVGLHSDRFDFNDDALPHAAALLAQIALYRSAAAD